MANFALAHTKSNHSQRYLWIWGHSPIIWKFARPKPTFCTKNNSTTLKVVLSPEPKVLNPWLWSEIRSMGKWPLSDLKIQNAILVWYLNENGLIWDIWGHFSLKSSQNHKLNFECARAKSTKSWLDSPDVFYDRLSFKKWAYSESWQNLKWNRAIYDHILLIKNW